jgi:predicted ATPase
VIASVAFRNFKALRATGLRLGPFNLLIGPNGSGKTSLIQAILQLRALAKLPLAEDSAFQASADLPEVDFSFAPPFETVEARLGCGSEMVCDLLRVKAPSPELWPVLKTSLGRMRSFVLDHAAMTAAAARSNGASLASNGSNLAAVLAWRRDHAPADYARLEAEALRIFPEFSAIAFASPSADTVELELVLADGSGKVSAVNLSQGTLYLLAVLALAFDPVPPTVLCIEEIDAHVARNS